MATGVGAAGRPAGVPGTVVKQLESERGRRARDFEVEITVLPVAGQVSWRPPGGALVVSAGLVQDGSAFRALLYDVLSSVV
jgi:hypothetical protein